MWIVILIDLQDNKKQVIPIRHLLYTILILRQQIKNFI